MSSGSRKVGDEEAGGEIGEGPGEGSLRAGEAAGPGTDRRDAATLPKRQGHTGETSLVATLKRTFSEFSEDNGTDWAASLTYYGIQALFPAILALVSIVALFGDPQSTTNTLLKIIHDVSPGNEKTFAGPIRSAISNKGASGIFALVGILLALNSASGYVGAFMRASNVQYEVDEGRKFIKLRPLQIAITGLMILLLALGLVAVVVTGPLADAIGKELGIGHTAVTIWDIAKWPVLVVIFVLMVSVLYYFAPNAKLPGFKWVSAGSLVAVGVWIVASLLFAFYVANFGSYNKTYGTFAGIIIALLWLWITNVAILLGNELNAERERTNQIADGDDRALTQIQLPERDAPSTEKRPKTA